MIKDKEDIKLIDGITKENIFEKLSLSSDDKGLEIALAALEAALEKKAEHPVILNLKDLTIITDLFLILSGNSKSQNKAIADKIEEVLREKSYGKPHQREGYEDAGWIVLDYLYVVIHIFTEEQRAFYDIENLWGDAPSVRLS